MVEGIGRAIVILGVALLFVGWWRNRRAVAAGTDRTSAEGIMILHGAGLFLVALTVVFQASPVVTKSLFILGTALMAAGWWRHSRAVAKGIPPAFLGSARLLLLATFPLILSRTVFNIESTAFLGAIFLVAFVFLGMGTIKIWQFRRSLHT